MRVVGVATTFEPARLGSADLIVTDLRSVRVRETGPDIVLEISSLDT
jgi:hypothetical protein